MVNEYSSLRLQGQYVSTEILMDQKTFLSSFWSKKTTWDSLPLRLFYDIRESKWEFDKGLWGLAGLSICCQTSQVCSEM